MTADRRHRCLAHGQYLRVDVPTFAAKHPVLGGLASGALMAVVGLALFGEWWVAVVGVVLGFGQWLL